MKTLKLSGSGLLLVLFLSGCATVDTMTTPFYTQEYKNAGTISVIAAVADVSYSPEFLQFKSRIEQKLAANGYSIASNPSEAEYIAFVTYGIDDGQNTVVSTPMLGQTGTTVSSSGGSSYTMPSYGVAGSSITSASQYTRAIALDIVVAASVKEGHPKKIYENRAKSVGSCRAISGVFDEMLEAMFEDFPGQSGKKRTVTVSFKGGC